MKCRNFILGMQDEFAKGRKAVADYIRRDLPFGRFFDMLMVCFLCAAGAVLPYGESEIATSRGWNVLPVGVSRTNTTTCGNKYHYLWQQVPLLVATSTSICRSFPQRCLNGILREGGHGAARWRGELVGLNFIAAAIARASEGWRKEKEG